MYSSVDGARVVVPTVLGASTLPATGGNTLLTVIVATLVVIGTIATITQIGIAAYRRKILSQQ